MFQLLLAASQRGRYTADLAIDLAERAFEPSPTLDIIKSLAGSHDIGAQARREVFKLGKVRAQRIALLAEPMKAIVGR